MSNMDERLHNELSSLQFDSPLKSVQPRWKRVQQSPSRRAAASNDRFIADRPGADDAGHYQLLSDDIDFGTLSPRRSEYRQRLARCVDLEGEKKVLQFAQRDDNSSVPKALHSQSLDMVPRFQAPRRTIPSVPEKVLDAPNMLDDFYLNLLDWSKQDVLAVSLGNAVYLWDAASGSVNELMQTDPAGYVSAVHWSGDGSHLAVGTSDAQIQLWDVRRLRRVRTMGGHPERVSALAWSGHTLSSGGRAGTLLHHDVRAASHVSARLSGHTQEICGLRWSEDGALASGGNDNIVNVYRGGCEQPQHSLAGHRAAVKALAWCPWQGGLLATGGGASDQTIRFWDTLTGRLVSQTNTGAQVCALAFATDARELVSAHGYSQNQLTVWRYPRMEKLAEFSAHESRVLHMALSPSGERVATAAGDENIKLWRVFEPRKRPVTIQPLMLR